MGSKYVFSRVLCCSCWVNHSEYFITATARFKLHSKPRKWEPDVYVDTRWEFRDKQPELEARQDLKDRLRLVYKFKFHLIPLSSVPGSCGCWHGTQTASRWHWGRRGWRWGAPTCTATPSRTRGWLRWCFPAGRRGWRWWRRWSCWRRRRRPCWGHVGRSSSWSLRSPFWENRTEDHMGWLLASLLVGMHEM